jgi:hypothetical protein
MKLYGRNPRNSNSNQLGVDDKHFFYWEVESILGPLGTAAIPGVLYLSRVNVMEHLVE